MMQVRVDKSRCTGHAQCGAPEYELADPAGAVEHTGGVFAIDALPLRWTV